MEEKIKSENPNIERCPCNNMLWDVLEEDVIRVFGASGEYIIGFNYIDFVCKKCKKTIHKTSGRMAEIIKELIEERAKEDKEFLHEIRSLGFKFRPYAYLSTQDKERIKNELNEKQREIFKILTTENLTYKGIIKRIGLSEKIAEKYFDTIYEEVKKVNPKFSFVQSFTKNLT